MEEFVLAKWESPPDCEAPLVAPADAVVELEWRGQKIEAKIRTVKIDSGVWWIFFQPYDEPLNNYTVVRKTSWPIKPGSWETRKTAQELSRIVRMATENQQFSRARFFYLREPQNAVAFFPVPDPEEVPLYGGWVDENEFFIEFKMRAATNAWDSPRLHHWLLKTWKKPDSEVRFAWQWSQWNDEYRHQWLYSQARGLNELERVMSWALQSERTIGNDEEWRWYFDFDNRYDDSGDNDRFWPESEAARTPWTNVDMQQHSPQLWALRQFFVSHFLPLPPLRINKPPLCVQDFNDLHSSHIMAKRRIQTAHEQLEAVLKLRDWLRKNNAPVELLSLLSR